MPDRHTHTQARDAFYPPHRGVLVTAGNSLAMKPEAGNGNEGHLEWTVNIPLGKLCLYTT